MKKLNIAIIDYDAGNLYSVQHACNFVGLNAEITSDKNKISQADGVILPGVGAFGAAMENLKKLDLIKPIKESVEMKKPFMGICLGMQLIFSKSHEFGIYKGLDLIPGEVLRFPNKNKSGKLIRVPQIGWNNIYPNNEKVWKNSCFKSVKSGEYMYFVHSYYCLPDEKKDVLSYTDYEGFKYCSSVLRENIFATQFHPEKSGPEGIKIYKEFAKSINKNK